MLEKSSSETLHTSSDSSQVFFTPLCQTYVCWKTSGEDNWINKHVLSQISLLHLATPRQAIKTFCHSTLSRLLFLFSDPDNRLTYINSILFNFVLFLFQLQKQWWKSFSEFCTLVYMCLSVIAKRIRSIKQYQIRYKSGTTWDFFLYCRLGIWDSLAIFHAPPSGPQLSWFSKLQSEERKEKVNICKWGLKHFVCFYASRLDCRSSGGPKWHFGKGESSR